MIIPSFTFQLLHIRTCVSSLFLCFSLFPAHHCSVFPAFCTCEMLYFPTLLSTRLNLRLLFCYLPGFFYCPDLLSKRSSISPPTFCPALGSFPQSPTAWFNDGLKLDKWAYRQRETYRQGFFDRIKAATVSDRSKRSHFSLLDWDWVRLAVTSGHSGPGEQNWSWSLASHPEQINLIMGLYWAPSGSVHFHYLCPNVFRCRGAEVRAQVVDHRSWVVKEKGIKTQVKGGRRGVGEQVRSAVGIAADGSGRGNALQHFRKGKYRSHFQELPRPYLKSHRPQIVNTF